MNNDLKRIACTCCRWTDHGCKSPSFRECTNVYSCELYSFVVWVVSSDIVKFEGCWYTGASGFDSGSEWSSKPMYVIIFSSSSFVKLDKSSHSLFAFDATLLFLMYFLVSKLNSWDIRKLFDSFRFFLWSNEFLFWKYS